MVRGARLQQPEPYMRNLQCGSWYRNGNGDNTVSVDGLTSALFTQALVHDHHQHQESQHVQREPQHTDMLCDQAEYRRMHIEPTYAHAICMPTIACDLSSPKYAGVE